MKKLSVIVVALLLVVLSGVAGASSELVGPKAFSMGGAFTAVADDASSFYWNPAGLTRSGFLGAELSLGISTSSFKSFMEFAKTFENDDLLAIVNQLQQSQEFDGRLTGFVGANMKNFSGGIIINEELKFDPTNPVSYRYSEKIGNLSMGLDLNKPFLNFGRLALGATVKIIQRDEYAYKFENGQFVLINSTPDSEKNQELGLDLGSLLRITDMINIAFVARDMKMTIQQAGQTKIQIMAPESLTLGAALKLPFPLAATVAADLEHVMGTKDALGNEVGGANILHVGAEKSFLLGLLSVRAGVFGPFEATERTFIDKMTYTAGLGVNFLALHADAAMGLSSDFQDFHSTLSASFKF